MPNVAPQFESKDIQGSTEQFSASVGTSSTAFPTVAGNRIEEVMIIAGDIGADQIFFSVDNTNWMPINSHGHLAWSLKYSVGGSAIKQIYLKGSDASLPVYGLINYSPADS